MTESPKPDLEAFCQSNETKWRELAENVLTETKEWESLPEDAWTFRKILNECSIWTRKYKNSSFFQLKAARTVKSTRSAEEFVRFVYRMQDCEELHDWYNTYDPLNIYYRNLHRFDPLFNVVHARTASTSRLVWDRDMTYVRKFGPTGDPNSCYMYGCSIDSPSLDLTAEGIPKDPSCVRCFLEGGFVYHATKNPETDELTYTLFLHVDPSGWVPSWIYNFVVFRKAACVSGYLAMFMRFEGESIEREDLEVPPVVERLNQLEREFLAAAQGQVGEEEEVEEEEGEWEEEVIEEVVEIIEEGEEEEEEEEEGAEDEEG